MLDIDSDHVEMLRRLGFNVFYIEELEDLLKIQQEKFARSADEAWDTDSMSNRGQSAATDSSS